MLRVHMKPNVLNWMYKVASSMRHYWHWRRPVAFVIFVTFFNSLLGPAFAQDKASASYNNTDTTHKIIQKTKKQPKVFSTPTEKYQVTNQRKALNSSIYKPYLEFGGAKYFNQATNVAGIYDLFIPLLQQEDQLLFADLRIFDRSGSAAEGNFHLGFRKLLTPKQLFGILGAFDYKKSVN